MVQLALKLEGKPTTFCGVLTRGGVPIEAVAFCQNGHVTAPNYEVGARDRPSVCAPSLCRGELAWVRDYDMEVMAALWRLGGADAVYEVIRQRWATSAPLEPR